MNTDTKKTFYSLSVLKHVKGGGEEREVGGGTKVFETEEKKHVGFFLQLSLFSLMGKSPFLFLHGLPPLKILE